MELRDVIDFLDGFEKFEMCKGLIVAVKKDGTIYIGVKATLSARGGNLKLNGFGGSVRKSIPIKGIRRLYNMSLDTIEKMFNDLSYQRILSF